MYKKTLEGLGFSAREVAVATSLISRKRGRSSEISEDTDLHRQTVNSILARLVHEGLVTATSGKGVRLFSCDHAQVLKYIDGKQERLQSLKHSLTTRTATPTSANTKQGKLPTVTYYEGSMGLEYLFKSMLSVYRKKETQRFRGYGINFLAKTQGIEDYIRYFLKERSRLGVTTDLFIAQGPDDFRITSTTTKLGREVKHLDIEEQAAGIYFVGNRVYMFSYKDNVGVMVENKVIVALMKSTFDDHWGKST